MRILGRLILYVLIIGVVASIAWVSHAWIESHFTKEVGVEEAPTRNTNIVYILDEQSWTTFPFAAPPRIVRLLSNADVPQSALGNYEASWSYGVEYEVLNAFGAVLSRGMVHLRAQLPAFRDPSTGNVVPTATYAGGTSALPTAVDPTFLDLSGFASAAEIRLRATALAPEVTGVAVRVYERRPIPGQGEKVLWQRMSGANRARLARGSVFPSEWLTSTERATLVRNRWLPIGPSGVEGHDYRGRALLSMDNEFEGERLRAPLPQPGVFIDIGTRTTITLPEGGGRVRFEIAPLEGGGNLGVQWYGVGLRERRVLDFPFGDKTHTAEAEFDGGLIELAANAPARVRAFLIGPGPRPRDLTPDVPLARAFVIKDQDELAYAVSVVDQERTPFRLVLRCEAASARTLPDAISTVRYVLAAKNGRVLKEGEIELDTRPSLYDRRADDPASPLCEPRSVYFNLPPDAASLRLFSDSSVLVAAYNRPPGLPRTFLVPEDQFAADAETGRRTTWYPLRPEEWDRLIAEGRAPAILVPRRPPEDDPDILAGRYQWEAFVPAGQWLTRDLLVPRIAEASTRREALVSVFAALPTDQPVPIELASGIGSKTVAPDILFLRDETGPMTISVHFDGVKVMETVVGAKRGVVSLPPLPAVRGVIELNASAPITAYINQVDNAPVRMLRRRAIRLTVGETIFEIEKRGGDEELLVGHVFPQGAARGRQNMRVTLEAATTRATGPFNQWTLFDRRYSIRLDPEQRDVAVLGADQFVGPDRTILIALGSDLPAGKYRLRIALEEGSEVYFSLSRTLPGAVEEYKFIQE